MSYVETDWTEASNLTDASEFATASELADVKDTADEAAEAVESVTNHFWYDDDGAHVSESETIADGVNNILIDSDSVDIRNGTTTLASFQEDLIELGKNSSSAEISMINGLGTISQVAKGSNNYLTIGSQFIENSATTSTSGNSADCLIHSSNSAISQDYASVQTVSEAGDTSFYLHASKYSNTNCVDISASVNKNYSGSSNAGSSAIQITAKRPNTSSDIWSNTLSIRDDKINLNGGVLAYPVSCFTKLWSGVLSKGGSATITNLNKYRVYMAIVGSSSSDTSDTALIGMTCNPDYSNTTTSYYVRCFGGYDDGTTSYQYRATLVVSGTTLKVTSCSRHKADGSSGTSMYLCQLWGLI